MSEWKCGNCGKIYDVYELISLKKIKVVESDTDPAKQHGYTPVCDCGYRFCLDRWRMNNNVKINVNGEELELFISTIFLELNHKTFDGKDEYYETAILWINKDNGETENMDIIERYETKESAIDDHNRILKLINDGKYRVEKVTTLEKEKNMILFDE